MDDSPDSSDSAIRAELEAYRAEVSRLRLLLDLQATIDLATGLLNAQGMLEPIRAAMDRLGRTGEPFAVCLVDFPSVHDLSVAERGGAMRHGAALLGASLRELDRVGRLEKSTFLLVLPELAETSVVPVLQRIANSVGVIPYAAGEHEVSLEPVFTVVLSPVAPSDAESLLSALAVARVDAAIGSPAVVRMSG